MTVVLKPEREVQIDFAVRLLKANDVVALPTETVYGLAGLALNTESLGKIFSLKARPHFDPLIVHVGKQADVKPLVREITKTHLDLMNAFWPGPLTLLFERSPLVPDLCTSGSEFVAIRRPNHPVFLEVLKRLEHPLAAPSANRFGRISPTSAQDVVEELGPYGLSAVIDGGVCTLGIESTVVKVEADNLVILRLGSLTIEEIKKVYTGPIEIGVSVAHASLQSPGQLDSHYAPRKSFYVFHKSKDFQKFVAENSKHKKLARLCIFPEDQELEVNSYSKTSVLSEKKSDLEAAQNLFATLRALDADDGVESIVCLLEGLRDEKLIPAIKDRLIRASLNKGI